MTLVCYCVILLIAKNLETVELNNRLARDLLTQTEVLFNNTAFIEAKHATVASVEDQKQVRERKSEQKQICDKLATSCDQLYAQILEERKKLQEKREKQTAQVDTTCDLTGNERRAKVLKAKAASYAAELESLKEGPVFSSSFKDPLIIKEDLKEEQKRNIEQYNVALNNIKSSIISLSNDIEGKQKTYEELQELFEQLEKKGKTKHGSTITK